MPKQCYICKKVNYLNPHLSYHSLPIDEEVRKLWLSIFNIDATTVVLPKRPSICSSHFADSDFEYRGYTKKKFFKRGAVPFPIILNCKTERRSSSDEELSPKRRDATQNLRSPQETSYNEGLSGATVKVEYESDTNATAGEDGDTPSKKFLHSELKIEEDTKPVATIPTTDISSLITWKKGVLMAASDDEEGVYGSRLAKERRRITANALNTSDYLIPKKAEQKLKIMQKKFQRQNKKIKRLQQTVRRFKRRVEIFVLLESDLKQKNSVLKNVR